MNAPKLRFQSFKDNWQSKKLSEVVASLDGGVSVNSEDRKPEKEEYSVLKTSCVTCHSFDETQRKVVLEKIEINRLKEPLIDNSIIISRMNTPLLVGANAYVKMAPKNTFLPDRLWQVKIYPNKINMYWLSLWLNNERNLEKIRALATGTSNSMKNITKSDVMDMFIFITSIEEQEKIANFFIAIDDKIIQLKKNFELLHEYKKGLIQKIFSQQLRFKNVEGKDFPEWNKYTLDKLLIPISRQVKKPNGNYLAIGIRSHFKGTFQKPDSEPEKIDMDVLYEVKKNDLIVNITFAWEGAVAITKAEDEGGLVSHRFPTYTFNAKYTNSNFFKYAFPNKHFKFMLEVNSPGGAGRNRVLNKKNFLKIDFLIPCLEEQTKIANLLANIDEKITNTQTQLSAMKKYKQGLLQQMFV